jgi:hypothetical protein
MAVIAWRVTAVRRFHQLEFSSAHAVAMSRLPEPFGLGAREIPPWPACGIVVRREESHGTRSRGRKGLKMAGGRCSPDSIARTGRRAAMMVVLMSALSAFPARADEPEAAADSDPLAPIVLQTRDEYTNLPDGAWQNSIIFRRDQLILKNLGAEKGRKGLLLRFDLPVTSVHAGSDTDTGLGDLYGQAVFFPRLTRSFGMGVGTGFYFPTASLDTTGSGKWSVAPLVVPIWFLPGVGGFAFVKAQDVISLGGSANRPDINSLLVTPTGVWRAGGRRWVLVDTEVRRDWENDLTFYKSGVQLGTKFGSGKGAWIKVEFPWGPNQQADWIVKTSFYRIR